MNWQDRDKTKLGFSKDFEFNHNWKKEYLVCGYEHCIENFPVSDEKTEFYCPIFGHNCPGGLEEKKYCGVILENIKSKNEFSDLSPKERLHRILEFLAYAELKKMEEGGEPLIRLRRFANEIKNMSTESQTIKFTKEDMKDLISYMKEMQ